jgi:glycosyltransferase involved in cell wall biosynthesis
VLLEPDRTVHPPSWLEHIPFAFWLIDVLRPRVFVELGTHSGNSYAAFAQAVQHFGLDSAGYAIDTWKGDAQAGFYDESVFLDWKDYHDRRYSAFSTLVRSTFDDAAAHFSDGSIDLLHIDGCHTAEAVSHDFETWRSRMSDRGVVLMHDINVRERDFGAWQTWERLKDTYPSFEFLHGHGLGVLGIGTNLPADLMWLLTAGAGHASRVLAARHLFARIGATILLRYEARDALATTETLDEATAVVQPTVEQLTAKLAGRAETIRRLRAAGEHAAADINRTQAELEHTKEEMDRLQRALGDAEAGIAEAVKDLSWHRDTQRVQEVLNDLAVDSTTVAAVELDALRARSRALAETLASLPSRLPSKLGRIWGTLRSLGITPSRLVRQPHGFVTLARLAARPRALREAHLVAQSGVFSAAHYRRSYPDVAARGLTPLAHFVLTGAKEGRSPHPLFDSAWYLTRHPDVGRSGANPLAHYLRTIAGEGRDPHPLFSVSYYRSQVTGTGAPPFEPLQHYTRHGALKDYSPHPLFDPRYYLETYGRSVGAADPLSHYLDTGAAQGFNPHPLFDAAYYQTQAPDARTGNPLRHYLEIGSAQGLRPHPLFDPAYYLSSNRDVAATRIEPLTHFVLSGGLEGRRPIREFDSAWYLQTYPDVESSRANPLTHFVRHGWREHRNPSANFDIIGYLALYPDVGKGGANPLVHYVEYGRAEGRTPGPHERVARHIDSDRRVALRASSPSGHARTARVVICLTHVMPTAPRAGNEYRIQRMLRWLRDSGYIVIPVIGPIRAERPTTAAIDALADEFGNAVVCQADGRLEYVLRDVPDVLGSLDGKFSARWATTLGEDLVTTEQDRNLLRIDRSFCTDALIETVMRLQTVLGPYVLLAEYIWMSRLLPLLDSRALKIIDTIDVFSTRAEKVDRYGVEDLTISPDDERIRLERADVIVAIQENERAVLESLAPSIPVITSGVDFDVVAHPGVPTGTSVLCVASGNPMNRRGLQDFIRFAWPRVRELVPAAELHVVGAVGESIALPPAGVVIRGQVADLAPLYAACSVVINPAMAGTGVKIKTLEALSYLRPIVTWPNGVDGVTPEVAALCRTVEDWYGFAEEVAGILASDRFVGFSAQERETLAREARPDRVYAELGRTLSEFFERQQTQPAKAATLP